ncbi:hypothetical protein UFOVP139_52 [uncultured Caudovirales phage]|uniref:Uncharacterized protein n=1 Tax=uncultured Caudovirales phage TaxID=2100421 RepID=A0A6J5LGQ2_9CAUD|nr:hypothetical protein UFOVP139_52 [uncultured Caudovirales phage]
MQTSLEMKIGGRTFRGEAIPEEFLALGADGIRAFAFAVGNEAAEDQARKGNPTTGIFVDGYRGRSPEDMKRNIVWEFASGAGSNLRKAVEEALVLCEQLSMSYAGAPKGHMANSWQVWYKGAKLDDLSVLDTLRPGHEDVRITSDMPYARFLESGHWTGDTRVLKREGRRGVRALTRGKIFKKHIAVTDEVSNKLDRKYKSLKIADAWYDKNPFGYAFADPKTKIADTRWPSIVFNIRKRML